MKIETYIAQDVLRPRLIQSGCLVVYDQKGQYRELCSSLATDSIRFIDVGQSSIEGRDSALSGIRWIGDESMGDKAILVYVPTSAPETDEDRQKDPFSVYATAGEIFPRDDGDQYLSLCLQCKPDHAAEIRRLFSSSADGPTFDVINAVGGGIGWPHLRTALGVESSREILIGLLAPSKKQQEALVSQGGWSGEVHAFLQATLGMKLTTRAKSWSPISAELWRFVLYSEFVFDLPGELPIQLNDVPRAAAEASPVVEDVCERLRSSVQTRDTYIERAQEVEKELDLASLCSALNDLGKRDTFLFEERTFLREAIKGITSGDTTACRAVLDNHGGSVWLETGESRAQWALLQAALNLVETCGDLERELPERARSQAELLDFYQASLREADRLQREFEQAVADFYDVHGVLSEAISFARNCYYSLMEKVQSAFMKHLEKQGWPPEGREQNAASFDRLVAPRLKESGRRIAYLMVDALRYELGVVLQRQLEDEGSVELSAAYAQLPTITPVGMASLLPGGQDELRLHYEKDVLTPKLNGAPVTNVKQRMAVLGARYGDRFQEMTLGDFVRKKPKVSSSVDLLVLRSTEIDSQLESNPESTLGLIPATLKLIRVALHQLRLIGFEEAVVVTDHGFFLNGQATAGDVCVKPQGAWSVNAHDRMFLGEGSSDTHNIVVSAGHVGVKGDFGRVAMPRSMAPYRAGHLYFHGGASLAEAVVPVLSVKLTSEEMHENARVEVQLRYRKGATRVTSRRPVVELALSTTDMFSVDSTVEILLEAQNKDGLVVGEAAPGADVNPATRTITLQPGQTKTIGLKMAEDFEGPFTVKALNPTTLAAFASLSLETDYAI